VSSHVVTVAAYDTGDGPVLIASCSCDAELLTWDDWATTRTMAELNEIVHEHIEDAERSEGYGGRPCPRPGHKHKISPC
jgi:ketosteroid isomerase-like protein